VLISLQDYGLREIVSGKTNFVGFANYAEVFGNATLWTVALPNTVVLAILSVAGTVALGTLVAVLMANLGPV
jgi:N,N'-diacetylchitobiose transport system permease protein